MTIPLINADPFCCGWNDHANRNNIGKTNYPLYHQFHMQAMSSPRGFKVHLPYQLTPGGDPYQSPAKYIYVYRNPKDALVSNFHFSVKFYPNDIPWDKYFEMCVSKEQYYGNIFDHVHGWYQHKGMLSYSAIASQ